MCDKTKKKNIIIFLKVDDNSKIFCILNLSFNDNANIKASAHFKSESSKSDYWSLAIFSSKRKYSCIDDASINEQHDCFKQSVIQPVSLLTSSILLRTDCPMKKASEGTTLGSSITISRRESSQTPKEADKAASFNYVTNVPKDYWVRTNLSEVQREPLGRIDNRIRREHQIVTFNI